MKKNEILLRVVENLLDENARLKQELDKVKHKPTFEDEVKSLIANANKRRESIFPYGVLHHLHQEFKVKRSRIVNDPTDMIQEYHDMIEQFEEQQVKDRMKHKFEKAGFVAGGEKIVPKPETHFEKISKLMTEFWKLQADFKEHQETKKESKS
jgi:hypothetical protein